MAIKWKVTLWYTLLMAALSILALVLIYNYTAYTSRVALESALEQAVALGANQTELDEQTYEIDDTEEIAQAYPGVSLYLYDEDGELLYGHGERLETPFRDGVTRVEHTSKGDVYLVRDMAISVSGRSMFVRGVSARQSASGEITSLRYISFIAFPLLVLLAAIGGYLLTRRAFLPVERITDTAREITKSRNFSMRIAASGPKDELHNLADTIDAMLRALENAYEGEKRLTADASHELRTPLAGILAQCENALAAESDGARRQALLQIKSSGQSMSSLINKLLLLARMDANSQTLEMEALDFSELVESCAMTFAETRDVHTQIDENVKMTGDQALLMRMVMNLLENAVRYGREDGVIDVSLTQDEAGIALTVSDDGSGIPESALPHIFERFFRADEAHASGGSGLGLPLVRAIAACHGGIAEAANRDGGGAVFRVQFPKPNP